MIYQAFASDTVKFSQLPETGMGYQIIEAIPSNDTIKKQFIIYNEQLIVDLDSGFEVNKKIIAKQGFSTTLKEVKLLSLDRNSIKLISKPIGTWHLGFSKKAEKERYSGGKGAKDSPKEPANGIQVFIRLSAYKDDRRIDLVNRKLTEGSFATTDRDYKTCLRTKDDPIDRYALPNDDEIKWAFYIRPKSGDIVQVGIVQPAFGHEGGGIEAYFENGTSNNTHFDTRPYGS